MSLRGQRERTISAANFGNKWRRVQHFFLKVGVPVFDSFPYAISDGDSPGMQMRLGVEKLSGHGHGQPLNANVQVFFKQDPHLVQRLNAGSGHSTTIFIQPTDAASWSYPFISRPYFRPLMQPSIRDSWSPSASGRSSPSTSATASEAHYSGDADDELTTSEDMSSAVASDPQGLRSRSPTRSDAASVYSYSSSMHHPTRDIYGRLFNNINDYYMLPADVDEHGRHDLQHEMLQLAMDGIFVNADAANRALSSGDGKTPAALDVGTGSGSWVVDCARRFPEAEVVGLDLAPANLTMLPPPNARFECDDANLGLTHYRNSFDVVNARACCSGFENYCGFLDDVLQVLRPGGVYQMLEGNLRFYDENRQMVPLQQDNDPNFSWAVKMGHAAHEAMRARGNGIDSYDQVPGWLEDMGSVWEEVGVKDVWVPIGPWENGDGKQKVIGEMNRQNVLRIVNSFRPLLLSYGYFDETIDNDDADDELSTSEDMSSDAISDLQDGASVYSYSSSVHHLTRDIHGRAFNNVNDSYMLPGIYPFADVDEHGRLDRQNEMLKLAMDGIFVNADAARLALAAKDGKRSAALDVGTGSGSWVVDCARMFPEVDVVGLDLTPAYLTTFDLINVRACCTGFENYRGFLDDILQVLRPGGIYQMVEGNLRFYDENRQVVPSQQDNDPNFSWTVKMAHAAHEAMTARGNGIYAYEQVPGWLKEMGSVWEEFGAKDFWVPIGPWEKGDEKQRTIGEMNRQNVLNLVNALRPLLLSYGYFDETIDKWISKVNEELRELKRPLYVRWHCAWAVKSRSQEQG
ncbi:hypothetical protein M407DRAFT_18615 [Tulasnella calospora MUT 4182]|uniref:Methyltransferase domain-containing protein n=1 Tax=Tulasnella calospora MUT 4182 TaxID=1051891 RepID=A0A0C3LF26_9AGAM|nr:hypothetical protein M407DRAFT_18615 [Tulasnella calospora MUT 4182]